MVGFLANPTICFLLAYPYKKGKKFVKNTGIGLRQKILQQAGQNGIITIYNNCDRKDKKLRITAVNAADYEER